MKKILYTISILSVTLLFIGCSSDNDSAENSALLQKIEGKWKLTQYVDDTPEGTYSVDDGYEMELKADKTFTSNEVDGYTGGKYSVIVKPGKNIKLVFRNTSGTKVLYKYLNEVQTNSLLAQYPQETPLSDEYGYYGGQVLVRIP